MINISSHLLKKLIALIIIFILILLVIIYASTNDYLVDIKLNILAKSSVILFLITAFLGFIDNRLYFLFLVFHFIAFPSVVNDLSPSILLGRSADITNAPYPFLTNIDVYLLIGIFIGILKGEKVYFKSNLISVAILIFILSTLVNIFYSNTKYEFLLLFVGSYHLRFLLLIYILANLFDFNKYQNEILQSFIISIGFLFIESIIFTYLRSSFRLGSGTLGGNTFGNIIASIAVFLIFSRKNIKNQNTKLLAIIGIFISICIVLFTRNRASFFILIILPPIIYYLRKEYNLFKIILNMLILTLLVFIVFLVFPVERLFDVLPDRLNVFSYLDKIHFNNGKLLIEISKETNPIISRLELYNTSINMVKKNPFFGIGAGKWNYLKTDYGFSEAKLIDSHNGLLAIISMYGIFALEFFYIIYIHPVVVWRKLKGKVNNPLIYTGLLSFGMLVCDITNAGISKYQVAALLIFVSVYLIKENKLYWRNI